MFNFNNISSNSNHSFNVVNYAIVEKFFDDKLDWVLTKNNVYDLALYVPFKIYVKFFYDLDTNEIHLCQFGFIDNTVGFYKFNFDAYVYNGILKTFNELTNLVSATLIHDYDSLSFMVENNYKFKNFDKLLNCSHIKNIFLFSYTAEHAHDFIIRLHEQLGCTDKNVFVLYPGGTIHTLFDSGVYETLKTIISVQHANDVTFTYGEMERILHKYKFFNNFPFVKKILSYYWKYDLIKIQNNGKKEKTKNIKNTKTKIV